MHEKNRARLTAALALWLALAHGGALHAAQREAATASQAPPAFPFRYSGRVERDGLPPLVALTRGSDTLLISPGDAIDSDYRLEEVGARHIVVTYVPLKQKQTIELSSLPAMKPAEPAPEKAPTVPMTPLGTPGPACC